MTHRHEATPDETAQAYGRHSHTHAPGPSALELLDRLARAGYALRLAWPTNTPTTEYSDEYPTAELPVIPTFDTPPTLFRAHRPDLGSANHGTIREDRCVLMGHMDEAAQAFSAAAELVPVQYAAGIEQELEGVQQYILQAGGQLGEELRQHTASIADQARQTTSLLALLKQKLEEAAIRAQQGAG